tara:strand:- start:56 stop:1498 length:1443 start_codon:yes stop_codon:yes gene_type:complete
MPKNESTLAGVGMMALLTIASKLVRLVALMITARFVTPEGFGVVASFTMVLAVAYLLAGMGMVRTIIQRPILNEFHIGSALRISILTSALIFILLFFYGGVIENLTGIVGVSASLAVASSLFIFLPFSNICSAIFQRDGKVVFIGKVQAACTVLGNILITIPLLWIDFGYWAIIIGAVVSDLIGQLIILWFGRKFITLKYNLDSTREIIKYSSIFLFNNIIEITSRQIDIAMVGRTLGAIALGSYSRATQLIEFPSQIYFLVVDRVVFPMMSSLSLHKEKSTNFFLNTFSILSLGLSVCILILYFGAYEIIAIMMGDQWAMVPPLLQILAISIYFKCISRFMDSYLSAIGKVKIMTFKQIVFLCLLLPAIWFGLDYGVTGVAVGMTIALFLRFLITASIVIFTSSLSLTQCSKVIVPTLISMSIIVAIQSIVQQFYYIEGLLAILISTLLWLVISFIYPQNIFLTDNGCVFVKKLKSKYL